MRFRVLAEVWQQHSEGDVLTLEQASQLLETSPRTLYRDAFCAERLAEDGYVLEVILEERDR